MIDRAKIYVKAGNGGSGCNSFEGVKFTRSRRPDGGGGGRGADVIIKVDSNTQTLEHLQFKQQFRAENGKQGQGNKKKGAQARPCVIKVPPGTVIRDLKNDLLLRDLIDPNEELIVAKGGEGGRGNARTKAATEGQPGEERHLFLELKLPADIALIGYPNTGKSTFLSNLTGARPKIASYPFTTTAPFLGVLKSSDFEEIPDLTVIEIPGLIKGSHQGKGLGTLFLKHAERAKVLIHLIDMAAQEGRDPVEDYRNLNQELALYNQGLSQKAQILVSNKMDIPQAKANLNGFSTQMNLKIYPISALTGAGIEGLLKHLKSYFSQEELNG